MNENYAPFVQELNDFLGQYRPVTNDWILTYKFGDVTFLGSCSWDSLLRLYQAFGEMIINGRFMEADMIEQRSSGFLPEDAARRVTKNFILAGPSKEEWSGN